MVGRVTPTILARDAFETCFCRRTRISSSLPSSRDFPSTPFGRPSSRPLARADANPSRGRSEIKSLSTSANRPEKKFHRPNTGPIVPKDSFFTQAHFNDFGLWIGSFAFGQVRRLDGHASLEWVFQRDDFGSDVTTGGLGLLESVVSGESGHHVGMRGNKDPQADPRNLRSGIDEGDRFQFIDTERCDFSGCAGLARLPVSRA